MDERRLEELRQKIKSPPYMQNAIDGIAEKLITEIGVENFQLKNKNLDISNSKQENKMKNSLTDLNNLLFEQIERLLDDEVCCDEKATSQEIKKAQAISELSIAITENAKVQLSVIKMKQNPSCKIGELPQTLLEKK